ncbi:unnamed protein product, partial [Adineta ricciae]
MLLFFLVVYLRTSFALLRSTEDRISTRNITCRHDVGLSVTFLTNCEACLVTSRNYAIETTLSLTGVGLSGSLSSCLQVNEVETYHENLVRECHYFPRNTLNGYDDFCIASPYTIFRGSYRACICLTNLCNFNYTGCLRQIKSIWNQKTPLFSNTIVELNNRIRCYQSSEGFTEPAYSSLISLCSEDDDICKSYLANQGVLCAISVDRANRITRQTLPPSIYSAYLMKYKSEFCKSYTLTSKSILFSQCELEDTKNKMPPKTPTKGSKIMKKQSKSNASKSGADVEKKSNKRKRKETYSIYIYKVLKQVHPDTGISSKAMSIMNSFVHDIFERLAGEASRLAHYSKRHTISSREIQTAVRLLLPGELAKHAVSEGTKAVT